MTKRKQKERLFVDCYDEWIEIYKVGDISDITLKKYRIASEFMKKGVVRQENLGMAFIPVVCEQLGEVSE